MYPVAKYRPFEKIGEGFTGEVYQGWDPTINRPVAIKFLRASSDGGSKRSEEFLERLGRESRAIQKLSHRNIAKVAAFVRDENRAYVVMEYVQGRSLSSWLSAWEPQRPQTVLDIIQQCASALDYGHTYGIVHGDIKPSNILIGNDGVVKIVDFGLASVCAFSAFKGTGSVETPHYMSPEQIKGSSVGPPSDQYSLAVCAYQMMTGIRPFEGDSITSLVNSILYATPSPARSLNPTLAAEVDTVLGTALSKRPEERFITCLQFAARLDRACAMTPSWRPVPVSKTVPVNSGGDTSDGMKSLMLPEGECGSSSTEERPVELPVPLEQRRSTRRTDFELKALLIASSLVRTAKLLTLLSLIGVGVAVLWEFCIGLFSSSGLNAWVSHITGNTDVGAAWLDFLLFAGAFIVIYLAFSLLHRIVRAQAHRKLNLASHPSHASL